MSVECCEYLRQNNDRQIKEILHRMNDIDTSKCETKLNTFDFSTMEDLSVGRKVALKALLLPSTWGANCTPSPECYTTGHLVSTSLSC